MAATTLMKQVVSSYLYGSLTPPTDFVNDALIRPTDETTTIFISSGTYMNTGAGRYATANQFTVVSKFFDSLNVLATGSYTLDQILPLLGLTDPNVDYTKLAIDHKEFSGGGDYLERVFVFNNSSFALDTTANLTFEVKSNGDREIKNLRIVPQQDNFDFIGGDGDTNELNEIVAPFIDPSDALTPSEQNDGLGRKVYISFTGTAPIDYTYTEADFNNDEAFIAAEKGLAIQVYALGGYMSAALQDFWDEGYTKFLDANDRPVLYGNDEANIFDASEIEDLYDSDTWVGWAGWSLNSDLSEYTDNGVVFIAGDGQDIVTGDQYDDVLYGGDGNDHLSGLLGNDTLVGGAGNDILDGGLGFEAVDYEILAADDDLVDLVVQAANKAEGQYSVTKTYDDGTTSYIEVDQLYGIERIGLAEHRANTTTYSNQTQSSVTGMLNNGFVTVWKSQSQDGQSHAIVGQRFDANGEAVGSEFVISSKADTSSYNFEGQVVDTNDGGFAVVWRGRTTSSTPDAYASNRKKVFVSKFDSNNDVDANIDSLMVFADPDQDPSDNLNRTQEWQPSMTLLGNGNLAIAAEAYGDGMVGADIITQVIDISSGARIGVDEDNPVNSSTSGNQLSAEVEALSSGGYVITWTDTNAADGSGSGVYGRIYHGNGGSAGSAFLVNQSTSSHQVAQNVTAVPDGSFIVTWASNHSGNYDIYIRHFSASGVALSDEILVNEETISSQIEPDIVMLDSSRFVVVFQNNDSSGDGSSYSIWGQQYDINATTGAIEKDGTNFLVNVTANGAQREPSVSALDNGDFAVSWTSDLPGLPGDEVAYRVFVTSDSENFDSSTGQWVA